MAPWPYNHPEYQRARTVLLAGNPICVRCGRRRATTADHHPVGVIQIREGRAPVELAWSLANLRPLCRSCNSSLGAQVGNRRRRRGQGVRGTWTRRW